MGYLKGVCHASFSTIRKYFRDVLKIPISRGQLAKVIRKVSESLEPAYQELRASLPSEPRLNVDETGMGAPSFALGRRAGDETHGGMKDEGGRMKYGR